MGDPASIVEAMELEPGQLAGVRGLLARAAGADGVHPLNEAATLRLTHPRPAVRHLLAISGRTLVGYAQLEDGPEASAAQLVVDPPARRHGVGSALVDRLSRSSARPLRIWAMGDGPAAQALAARTGLVAARTLLVMNRSLTGSLPPAEPPPGVTIRPFAPGRDEAGWLALNAAAFAGHPEQAGIGHDDLAERVGQAWFDPAGFLLAEASGRLVGFHWTKRHPGRLGEVYVLGVAPDQGGRGLGKALLRAGLDYLRDAGDERVELYVEADHEAAVALYRSYGFRTASRDVMYARR